MDSMDCTLYSPDGKEIKCKYYEIEEKCKEIIENAIIEEPKLEKNFLEFRKKYTYFKPYFDFVLSKLGYTLLNPFDLEDAYLYVLEDCIIIYYKGEEFELFPLSDDEHIGLYQVSEDNLELSMVDENLNGIKPKDYRHLFTSRLILHNYFINDKDLYIEYLRKRDTFSLYDYTTFLIYHKPFLRLDKSVKTEKTKNLVVFKDCDIFYQIQGCLENVSEKQDTWMQKIIIKNIIKKEDIKLSSKERIESRLK